MRARAVVVADVGDAGRTRLRTLRSEPPITLRPTPHALYVAASAAGPLGGDVIELDITVGPGAELTVRTVAAAVALPGPGGTSTLRMRLHVAGRLAVLPEPTIVADRADHHTDVTAEVTGALILREEVILGRHHERGGHYRSTAHVDVAGAPLLRSDLAIAGPDQASTGRASAIACRATGSLLFAGAAAIPEVDASPTLDVAALTLAGPGLLVTAVAADGRTLRTHLDRWHRPLVG